MFPGVVILILCLMLNLRLYADNLKRSAARPRALFESARFTAQYVRSVGQDVSPGQCVLISTSETVRKAMKLWDISGDGGFWKVQLDVRDLGGHLDFTFRARAGTLSRRVGEATVGVAAVRGKFLPAGLHAAEASYVSSSSISAFRAAIVRAVWSTKMPLADSPAILNLLDGKSDGDGHLFWGVICVALLIEQHTPPVLVDVAEIRSVSPSQLGAKFCSFPEVLFPSGSRG